MSAIEIGSPLSRNSINIGLCIAGVLSHSHVINNSVSELRLLRLPYSIQTNTNYTLIDAISGSSLKHSV